MSFKTIYLCDRCEAVLEPCKATKQFPLGRRSTVVQMSLRRVHLYDERATEHYFSDLCPVCAPPVLLQVASLTAVLKRDG